MKNAYEKISNFELSKYLKRHIAKADSSFWSAFIAAFLALNLIFIYHGASFLFGDHDWRYLKEGISLSAGLFEGRFAQFLLINLLSQGEILPIINNVIGFTGFSLGIALLAKYWQLPHKKMAYIGFALFSAITPYILSFMYFAFLIAPILSWNAFIIGALVISERESEFSIKKTLSAIVLITLALGGYPPVINLIGTAFIARLLIAVCYEKSTIQTLIKNYRWTVINVILAAICYKLCLIYLTHTGAINSSYYNLQTTPVSEWGNKLILIIKDMILQFSATLPFIEKSYKIAISLIVLLALSIVIKQKQNRILAIFLFISIYLAGLVTLFLSTSIKETEFSPRIDFFGLMYGISAAWAIILKSKQKFTKNLSWFIAVFCIYINTNTLMEAQKVWHLGFKTEMSLYKRIARRFQSDELFNQYGHYIIVQGGSPSFREKFYQTNYQYNSDDLLSISYVPGLAPGVMWNYYGIYEYADTTSYEYTFKPDDAFKKALEQAKPYPAKESTAIGGYWIMVTLTSDGIERLRKKYL